MRKVVALLAAGAVEFIELNGFMHHYSYAIGKHGWEGAKRIRQAQERKAMWETIRELEKKRMFELHAEGKNILISLTKSGEIERLRWAIIRAEEIPGSKGVLVVYDFQEHLNASRDVVRHFLKSAGFEAVQKSVWISKKSCRQDLESWIRRNGFDRWIRTYSVSMD